MRKKAKVSQKVPRGTKRAQSNGSLPIKTAADLARALGVRHQVVTAHRRKENAPPIENVEQWRLFLAQVTKNGAISPSMASKIAGQRLRIARATAERIERENEVKAGQRVEFSEVRKAALDFMSYLFGEADRWRQTWPSLLKGRTELEIFTELDRDIASFREGLKARLEGMGK